MARMWYKVTLTVQERSCLRRSQRAAGITARKALNALFLLGCDQGQFQAKKITGQQLADVLPVSLRKIDRVKRRFVEEGLEVALGKRKPERQYVKKADGDFEAHLVALSCSQPPEGYARWSLRLLADKMVELEYVESVSHETVRRVLTETS